MKKWIAYGLMIGLSLGVGAECEVWITFAAVLNAHIILIN
jgi:hypothetical protein